MVTHALITAKDAAAAGFQWPVAAVKVSPAAPNISDLLVTSTKLIALVALSMFSPPALRAGSHGEFSDTSRSGRYARSCTRRSHRESASGSSTAAPPRS